MSYQAGAALQQAVFTHLRAAADLAAVVITDAQPDPIPPTYVLIGPETVRDASDQTGQAAEHRLRLSVISTAAGFLAAKQIAAVLAARMQLALPALAVGRVVWLRFLTGEARRLDGGANRRIDLIYQVRIEL